VINAAGILFRSPEGRVLLLRRTAEGDHEGEWAIPGGKIEEGESAAKAAVREVWEEIQFRAGHAGVYHTRQVRNGVDYTTYLYEVDDEFVPKLNGEHDAYMWVSPLAALKENVQPKKRADASWEEAKHPRDEKGKFTGEGGSGAAPKSKLLVKVGEQKGSMPGGTFKDQDGKHHYVKFYPNKEQSKTEALAGDILAQMGVQTTKPEYQITNGQASVSTKYNNSLKPVGLNGLLNEDFSDADKKELAKMFAGAIMTNNWDVTGIDGNNIARNEVTGELTQMDLGGSFEFRAMGEHKYYTGDGKLAETLLDPQYPAGKVFSKLFNENPKLLEDAYWEIKNIDKDAAMWAFKQSGLTNAKELHDKFAERQEAVLGVLGAKLNDINAPAIEASMKQPSAPAPSLKPAPIAGPQQGAIGAGPLPELSPIAQQAQKDYSQHLISAFKGLEKGSPEYKEAQNQLASLKAKMFAAAPPGYFEAKTAATKAAKAAKEAAKAAKVPAPAAPAPTPAPVQEQETEGATGAPKAAHDVLEGNGFEFKYYSDFSDTFIYKKNDATIKVSPDGSWKSYTSGGDGSPTKLGDNVEDLKEWIGVKTIAPKPAPGPSPGSKWATTVAAKAKELLDLEASPGYSATSTYQATHKELQEAAGEFYGIAMNSPSNTVEYANWNKLSEAVDNFLKTKQGVIAAKASGNESTKQAAKNVAIQAKQKLQSILAAAKETGPLAVPAQKSHGLEHPDNVTDVWGNVSIEGLNRYEHHSQHGTVFKEAMKQKPLKSDERQAVVDYKGSDYREINRQCRAGQTLSKQGAKWATALDRACQAGTIPKGTVLYRGIKHWKEAGLPMSPLEAVKANKCYHDNGFSSASTSKSFAGAWSGGGDDAVVFEYIFDHDKQGCHVAAAKGSGYDDSEQEVILPRSILVTEMVGYRREKLHGKFKHIITMRTM
jgi:8-oxo-dGTP pyrophosphatase MutT (NUDIX family)